VWSVDWWSDSAREIQRAHGAIVAALAASRRQRTPEAERTPARPRTARGSAPIATTLAAEPAIASGSGPTELAGDGATTRTRISRGSIPIGPYLAAAIPAGRRVPDDMFAARHLAELGKIVEQVLAAEAPIHVDLLGRRVGAYFGIGRMSARETDQIREVLAGRGQCDEHGIVWRLDQDPTGVPAVRVAGAGAEARRDIAEVPLPEVAAAVRIVVERASGIGTTELVRDCARLLGFARITERVVERVGQGVRLAAHRELIAIDDGKAHPILG
jgi:hypothetical protein